MDDTVHATYIKEIASAFHQALLKIYAVLLKFSSEFKGKSSPIHFFWGGFDLAIHASVVVVRPNILEAFQIYQTGLHRKLIQMK